jgi:hypothetical protein
MIREIGCNLFVSRGDRPAPRLEVVQVSAVGAPRRRSDAGLDIRLNWVDRQSIAVNCICFTKVPEPR